MADKKKIVLATQNENKVKELIKIEQDKIELQMVPKKVNWDETGATFFDNALIKARAVKPHTTLGVIGEDSGLVVEDLGGDPGVYSKRYAGVDSSDQKNTEKLLTELAKLKESTRKAYFITSIAYIDPKGNIQAFEGRCIGKILSAPRGTDGFGYDPVFLPDGYDKSFAELPLSIKNTISHRFKAFQAFLKSLE